MKKHSITSIQNLKGVQKITMVTAYDALFARLFDGEVDCILVGDSLNMSFAGKNDTLSATMDQMIYHTQAVCNGAKNSFIICDMPFGTYSDMSSAFLNAKRVYQETSADAVKIEGGIEKAHIVKHLTDNSIAVVGHIGLMPQNFRSEGGYKVKGKDEENIQRMINDAQAIEHAGAFMIVLEGVKSEAAKVISEAISIPVIGIGAGIDTDGASLIKNSLKQYTTDVKNKNFPSDSEVY